MTCSSTDLFDINGKNKLTQECVSERESIIAFHAKNPKAAFFFSHSSGKDSAAAYEVVKAIVPAKQLFVIHATLGSVEHDGVISYIEDNIESPLFVVRNERKDFIGMVLLRKLFPSPKYRQCTSDLKTSPIFKFIRAYMKANGFTTGFNISGLRAEESVNRALKSPLWLNKELSKAGRTVFDWMPIFEKTTSEVFETIAKAGKVPHQAYGDFYAENNVGNQRLSCIFCIMGSLSDLVLGAINYPKHYVEMIALERVTNHTMFGKSKVIHTDKEMNKGTILAGGAKVITSELNTSKRAIMAYKNKTFIPVPLSEKVGVPFDELAVQREMVRLIALQKDLIANVEQEKLDKAAIKTAKAKKIGSKTKKRDAATIDWVGEAV
jgi:3'-phosphoadenosine 5'-phosphosulfate sulfotransferase (PAPS reductase)/FAD synthetase